MAYEIAFMGAAHFAPEYAGYQWHRLLKAFFLFLCPTLWGLIWGWQSLKAICGAGTTD